ncbi:MAG: hypothetical protein GX620_03825, partial [Chloroflexi bacterium]|nr:hypothetical protein [Chloroflexota bacterium]
IKPQNVIITPEDRAVLVDFGLVKLWDPAAPKTRTVMRGMGTPEYAPPEQWGAQGKHTDPRSDLYSLGATLYHALAGQAPPTASDRMVYPKEFKTPHELNGSVSSTVDAAITRAMVLAIDERWPEARTMSSNLLSPAQDAGTSPASPPAPTQRLPHSQRTAIESTPFGINIRIENRSPDEICHVYISPSDKASWGADQLSDDESIGSGNARVFALPVGSYDIRVETWNQVLVAAAADISGDTAIRIGDRAAILRLLVDNRSPWEICSVYIVPAGSSDWGADWMDTNESLLPNGKRMFYLKPGTYDLCAVNCDGETFADEYGIGVTEDVTWTLGN